MRCSVVVTTWKRPVLLRATLDALARQSFADMEIVVVCDGEDGQVRQIAAEFHCSFPLRWIFHPVNRGLPAARNSGARAALGDILLFLDDDVIADPNLVAAHIGHHHVAGGRRIAICSHAREERHTPLTTFVDRCLHAAWTQSQDGVSALLTRTGMDAVGDAVEQVLWFGLNCSVRRDVFLSLGGFDESMQGSDEETEMGLRMHLSGVEVVFDPRILLTHRNSRQLKPYFLHAWRSSGTLDVHRVFTRGQQNAQTRRLLAMFHGYWLDRTAAHLAWHLSGPLRALAAVLSAAAEGTKWRWLAGAWTRVAQNAEYWSGVRESKCTRPQLRQLAGPAHRVLMLHSISAPPSKKEATYYIRPARFHRMIRQMQRGGYRTATLDEWINGLAGDHQVLLTFDDGYDDLYDELLPLVIQHRYTPVVFLVVDRIGEMNVWDYPLGVRARRLLTLEQIRAMQKHGVEFGSHTLTHPFLPSVSDEQLRREVADSRSRLQDLLGAPVRAFAYPSGGVDRRVRSAVAEAGYGAAFTTLPGENWWNDPLCQLRADVNDLMSPWAFHFQLRHGRPFAQLVSEWLKSLENQIPTAALRAGIRGVRHAGHRALNQRARRGQNEQ
ncbi:MAG TPA: polysaccharide deacetylase family protein [Terracidiphilus sp.]|nr:polysaccharide deacetylase family protein [Terracidiphilus sp.]